MATQVASSALPLGHPNVRRMPRTHCRIRGAVPPLVMLPYTAGVSEDIRQVCTKYGMRVIFRFGLSLRSVLTWVKDPLPMESGPRSCTESPAVAARSTSVRPEEGWR